MKVYVESLGCRLNYSEMDWLARGLAGAGHLVVTAPEQADVCVLNTCAVTGEAARKSRQLARRLARANPMARLALTGCYATLSPEAAGRLPNVQLVVDNQQKEQLAELLQSWSAELDVEDWRRLEQDAPPHQASRTRAFVKVQDGCDNRCTFCIVTLARGRERSRPIGLIVAEIQDLIAQGFQEVVLTGVHLGGYGSDLDITLVELVSAILDHTELPRLRLSSLEPWDLGWTGRIAPQRFFDLWQRSRGRLCPHLHLPLQSGCDRILRRMARRNRTADFRDLVTEARRRIPGLVLTTDIIAGFPGETEEDFAASLQFVQAMQFAHVHAFPYSAREGTSAASFGDQVPIAERRRRLAAMQAVSQRSAIAVRRQALGHVRPVLWEQQIGEVGDSSAAWAGLTDNYLRVRTMVPTGHDLANQITPARLVALEDQVIDAVVER